MQNPLFQLAKENLLTREKAHVKADGGWGKVLFPGPHPPSATVPPLPQRARVIFWMMDCDFSFGSAQNDRVVWVVGKRISFRALQTYKIETVMGTLLLG